ncbi:hypothetical protein Ddye_010073 [Dipteronia dyeriana]|uniref:Reverse transcriptase zinc-binding domain-containing protein n=1 Tax=Dipteronia dyeriana TaxID=168575 RepID=A0AAD9XD63_9ROSI|nr:hypothetical protein Ddye_010073 [Dipteronia dyeriana]
MQMPLIDGGPGFRDLELSNRALLAKQCWRLLKNPNSLAGRILKGCYYKDCNFLEAKKMVNASFVWNSLIWGKGLLEAGLRWSVGDGKSINIYKDKWVPRPSTFRILSPPKLNDQLISSSGGWNTNFIKQNFSDEDVNSILQIPIGCGSRGDNIIWHYNENGQYSVKSGYWLGHKLATTANTSNSSALNTWWNSLWRVKICMKVKIFVWKACQDWIPTKINIDGRGIKTNGICETCNTSYETTLHALWECSKLRKTRDEWYNNNAMTSLS